MPDTPAEATLAEIEAARKLAERCAKRAEMELRCGNRTESPYNAARLLDEAAIALRSSLDEVAGLTRRAVSAEEDWQAAEAENERLREALERISNGEAFREQRFAEDNDAEYFLRAQRKVMLAARAALGQQP